MKCQHCGGDFSNRTADVCGDCFRAATVVVLRPDQLNKPWTAFEVEDVRRAYQKEYEAADSKDRDTVREKWKTLFAKNASQRDLELFLSEAPTT